MFRLFGMDVGRRGPGRITSGVNARGEALVRHSFQGIAHWQQSLRSIANQLEDLERRAKGGRAGEDGLAEDLVREPGPDDSGSKGQAGGG